nr:MAG TPA: hypothetical protein [Caudoviricetes sp.]
MFILISYCYLFNLYCIIRHLKQEINYYRRNF